MLPRSRFVAEVVAYGLGCYCLGLGVGLGVRVVRGRPPALQLVPDLSERRADDLAA